MRIDIVNRPSMAHQLTAILPLGWTVSESPTLTPSQEPGFVLLWEPSREAVREARRLQPRSEVVALLDRRSPPALVTQAMDSGAAACIRDPTDVVVICYLQRLSIRRRTAAEHDPELTGG